MKTQDMKMQDKKMLNIEMQDVKMQHTKNRRHETTVYLIGIYWVLVLNALIWCGIFYWVCTQETNVFVLLSLCLPGYNVN